MKAIIIFFVFPFSTFAPWTQQITPTNINMVLSIDFINTNTGIAGGWQSGFTGKAIYTTNSGANWILAQVPDSARSLVKVQPINSTTGYIAGAYNIIPKVTRNLSKTSSHYYHRIGLTGEGEDYKGLFLKTTDGGHNWFTYGTLPVNVYYLLGMHFINDMTGFVSASFNYSGGISDGVLKTTNGGISWNTLVTVDSASLSNIFTTDGNNIYVAGWARGSGTLYEYGIILRTSNGGLNWSRHDITYANYFQDVFFTNLTTGFVVGGTEGNIIVSDSIPRGVIYKTTNSGSSWFRLPVQLDSTFYYGVKLVNGTGKGIVVGEKWSPSTWKMLISRTTNYGSNWSHYIGLDTNLLISSSLVDQNVWFVCGGGGYELIYKTTTGGEPIGIEPINSEVPASSALYQNYPNPFNASTKFKVQIAKLNDVKVIVYNILGREVTFLVNEQLKPGSYEVEWDAANYPSGVYYYRLIATDYTETKKMILLK